MKHLLLLVLLPLILFSQNNNNCGDRPSKPVQSVDQTKKEYKKSESFTEYKRLLKVWKACVSPMGISKRDSLKIEKRKLQRAINKNKVKNDHS